MNIYYIFFVIIVTGLVVTINSAPSTWIQKIAQNKSSLDRSDLLNNEITNSDRNYKDNLEDNEISSSFPNPNNNETLPTIESTNLTVTRKPETFFNQTLELNGTRSTTQSPKTSNVAVRKGVDGAAAVNTTHSTNFGNNNMTMHLAKSRRDENENIIIWGTLNGTNNNTTTLLNTNANGTSTEIDPVFQQNSTMNFNETASRPPRQDSDESNETAEDDDDDSGSSIDESSEEEDESMFTGLLSALLSGLSRPDGTVDVESLVQLLGTLSAQNDDGSYDFTGLTELLMSFFGGEVEEGGSDFGAFLGGLLGAFLKGVAKPPGPVGVGAFTGDIVTGILPALSAPAPSSTEDDNDDPPRPQGLDSGGFLTGLMSRVLRGLGGGSGSANLSGGSSGNKTQLGIGNGGSKFPVFKAMFSMFSSIFTSSSAQQGARST